MLAGDNLTAGEILKLKVFKTKAAHLLSVISGRNNQNDKVINPFTDVKPDDWCYDSIMYMYQYKLMIGTSDTTFSPSMPTSRAMMVTILWRLDGMPVSSTDISFDDVASGEYYSEAIAWAAANGIVNGYGDGRFGPNDYITREQMATMLFHYAKYRRYDVSKRVDLSKAFTDGSKVSDYAVDAMSWASAEGLFIGRDNGLLDPASCAARSEVATTVFRFCESIK